MGKWGSGIYVVVIRINPKWRMRRPKQRKICNQKVSLILVNNIEEKQVAVCSLFS